MAWSDQTAASASCSVFQRACSDCHQVLMRTCDLASAWSTCQPCCQWLHRSQTQLQQRWQQNWRSGAKLIPNQRSGLETYAPRSLHFQTAEEDSGLHWPLKMLEETNAA